MPAYSITEVEVLDPNATQALRRGGRRRGRAIRRTLPRPRRRTTVAEGEWPSQQRVVIIEFPTMDRLRAWYDSPEYAPARALAPAALRRQLLFVEGIDA